jgi:hypothetical protein
MISRGLIEYLTLTLASGATALGSVNGTDLPFIKLTHHRRRRKLNDYIILST